MITLKKTNKGKRRWLRFIKFTLILELYQFMFTYYREDLSASVHLFSPQHLGYVSLFTVCRHSQSWFHQLTTGYLRKTNFLHPQRCISLTNAAPAPKQSRLCLFVYLLGHGESETKFRQLTVWGLRKSAVWSGASHLPATASATKENKAMAGGDGVRWREARPGDTAGHRAGMWGRWHYDRQLMHEEKYYYSVIVRKL